MVLVSEENGFAYETWLHTFKGSCLYTMSSHYSK